MEPMVITRNYIPTCASRNISEYRCRGGKSATYHAPLQFNLKAVDMVYAEIDECRETVKVAAIQVTIARQHVDSEAMLFAD